MTILARHQPPVESVTCSCISVVGLECESQARFSIVVRAKRRILRALSGTGEAIMSQGALATLIGVILMAASSALATTTAPGAAPGEFTGGIGDYWWIILLVIVIAAAIWYYMKGRNRV